MRCVAWKCPKVSVWVIIEHISRGECKVRGYCQECLDELEESKVIKKWRIDECKTETIQVC